MKTDVKETETGYDVEIDLPGFKKEEVTSAKDALLTIIVFPLQIPLLLGGIRIGEGLMRGGLWSDVSGWFGLVFAFDAVFAGAALFLFPYVFRGE